MFLGDRINPTTRRARKWITIRDDGAFLRAKLLARKRPSVSLLVLVCAAVLAFESLDRERQVELVLKAHPGTKTNHRQDYYNVPGPFFTWEKLSRWSFPTATRAIVMRAVMQAFFELPADDQDSWIQEAVVLIGDPRQKEAQHAVVQR